MIQGWNSPTIIAKFLVECIHMQDKWYSNLSVAIYNMFDEFHAKVPLGSSFP